MRIGRRGLMIAGTFFLAAATGHVMQGGYGAFARKGEAGNLAAASLTSASYGTATDPESAADAVALPAAALAQLPDFPDLPALPAELPATTVRLASRLADAPIAAHDLTVVSREYDSFGRMCDAATLTLGHMPPALLSVTLNAPCHASEQVRLSHGPMRFDAVLDGQGRLAVTLPAMATEGRVVADLASGLRLQEVRPVPDIGAVRRVALVARAGDDIRLRATVAGADGTTLAITAESPGFAGIGGSGFLTSLGTAAGDDARVADVITLPAGDTAARVMVEAEVSPTNCARDMLVTLLAADGTAVPALGAISLSMPECNLAGARMVLGDQLVAGAVRMASAP